MAKAAGTTLKITTVARYELGDADVARYVAQLIEAKGDGPYTDNGGPELLGDAVEEFTAEVE